MLFAETLLDEMLNKKMVKKINNLNFILLIFNLSLYLNYNFYRTFFQ